MKSVILLLMFSLPGGFAYADWQDVINQEEQKALSNEVKVLNENFKLEKITTQENFEKILLNKLYNKVIDSCNPYYPLYYDRVLLKGLNITSSTSKNPNKIEKINYGKTNLQKENVDEPEVIKLTKDYIAYYNQQDKKVYIIKSPVNKNSLDLSVVNIFDVIKVPSVIYSNSVKLFFVNNQLIVIGTRYSKALKQNITDLVFYKINNGKAKFSRLYDVKGNFKDARIVDDKIYLITDYNFGNIARQICDKYFTKPIVPLRKKIESLYFNSSLSHGEILQKRKEIENEIKSKIKEIRNGLDKHQVLEDLKNKILLRNVDIIFDETSKLKFNGKNYPLKIRLVNSALNNILFIPTDFDKIDVYNLKFNIVNIVDLDSGKNPNQYIIFGNISNGQIHMTTKSLYLVNTYYRNYFWKCRPGLKCILSVFPRGEFTLIHKLGLNGFNLDYINSQIIPGMPINQYSMDEDKNGNFRIFTKHYYPQKATDLYVFDKNLKLKGKLLNIALGEEFKSSRFMQDIAYLVTFKATDPLFVIDLQDLSNPKILGELKIPGYSLYLHPLVKKNNVQYLLGIGQQAEEVHGNWSLPKNIKIDIYKVYLRSEEGIGGQMRKSDEVRRERNSSNMLKVEKVYSYILGNEKKVGNGGSYTPVFDNPRTFVLRSEEGIGGQMRKSDEGRGEELGLRSEEGIGGQMRKSDEVRGNIQKGVYNGKESFILLLPVYLTEDEIEKRCYPVYKYENSQRILLRENCYEYNSKKPYFVGIKGLKIDLSKGISEILSKNYLKLYEKAGISLNQWKYKNENHRVSYYEKGTDFIPFEINVNFADFFKGENDKFIPFNDKFNFKDSNFIPPKQCFYTKPAPGTVTCQMYCGQRWVLRNGECKQILVSAACSCPGFDTKSHCEENCLAK